MARAVVWCVAVVVLAGCCHFLQEARAASVGVASSGSGLCPCDGDATEHEAGMSPSCNKKVLRLLENTGKALTQVSDALRTGPNKNNNNNVATATINLGGLPGYGHAPLPVQHPYYYVLPNGQTGYQQSNNLQGSYGQTAYGNSYSSGFSSNQGGSSSSSCMSSSSSQDKSGTQYYVQLPNGNVQALNDFIRDAKQSSSSKSSSSSSSSASSSTTSSGSRTTDDFKVVMPDKKEISYKDYLDVVKTIDESHPVQVLLPNGDVVEVTSSDDIEEITKETPSAIILLKNGAGIHANSYTNIVSNYRNNQLQIVLPNGEVKPLITSSKKSSTSSSSSNSNSSSNDGDRKGQSSTNNNGNGQGHPEGGYGQDDTTTTTTTSRPSFNSISQHSEHNESETKSAGSSSSSASSHKHTDNSDIKSSSAAAAAASSSAKKTSDHKDKDVVQEDGTKVHESEDDSKEVKQANAAAASSSAKNEVTKNGNTVNKKTSSTSASSSSTSHSTKETKTIKKTVSKDSPSDKDSSTTQHGDSTSTTTSGSASTTTTPSPEKGGSTQSGSSSNTYNTYILNDGTVVRSSDGSRPANANYGISSSGQVVYLDNESTTSSDSLTSPSGKDNLGYSGTSTTPSQDGQGGSGTSTTPSQDGQGDSETSTTPSPGGNQSDYKNNNNSNSINYYITVNGSIIKNSGYRPSNAKFAVTKNGQVVYVFSNSNDSAVSSSTTPNPNGNKDDSGTSTTPSSSGNNYNKSNSINYYITLDGTVMKNSGSKPSNVKWAITDDGQVVYVFDGSSGSTTVSSSTTTPNPYGTQDGSSTTSSPDSFTYFILADGTMVKNTGGSIPAKAVFGVTADRDIVPLSTYGSTTTSSGDSSYATTPSPSSGSTSPPFSSWFKSFILEDGTVVANDGHTKPDNVKFGMTYSGDIIKFASSSSTTASGSGTSTTPTPGTKHGSGFSQAFTEFILTDGSVVPNDGSVDVPYNAIKYGITKNGSVVTFSSTGSSSSTTTTPRTTYSGSGSSSSPSPTTSSSHNSPHDGAGAKPDELVYGITKDGKVVKLTDQPSSGSSSTTTTPRPNGGSTNHVTSNQQTNDFSYFITKRGDVVKVQPNGSQPSNQPQSTSPSSPSSTNYEYVFNQNGQVVIVPTGNTNTVAYQQVTDQYGNTHLVPVSQSQPTQPASTSSPSSPTSSSSSTKTVYGASLKRVTLTDSTGKTIQAYVVVDQGPGSYNTPADHTTNFLSASQSSREFSVVTDNNGNSYLVPKSSGQSNGHTTSQQGQQPDFIVISGADGKTYVVEKGCATGTLSVVAQQSQSASPCSSESSGTGQQYTKITWENIVSPDGSVLSVPVKTVYNADGSFTAQVSYNPSSQSRKVLCSKHAAASSFSTTSFARPTAASCPCETVVL